MARREADFDHDPRITSCPGCLCRVWKFVREGKQDQYAIRIGSVRVDIDGVLEIRGAFTLHEGCEGLQEWRKMKAQERDRLYQDRRRKWAKQKEARKVATEWVRQAQWVLAHRVTCPKCQAEPGQDCLNLVSRARGVTEVVRWPHAERSILADPDPGPDDPWVER